MGERLITFTGATVLVGLLFGAGPAWAGDAPVWKPTRFEIEARYFVVNEVEGASLVNGPVEGSSLDLVRDTGLDEKDNLDLRFNVRTGEAGRVRFAFGRLDFEGVGTVDRPVFWQGAFFQAGTDVASTLRQQYYRAEWIGQFIRLGDGVFRAGPILGVHVWKAKVRLASDTIPDGVRETFNNIAPAVGLAVDFQPHRVVDFFVEASGFDQSAAGWHLDAEGGVRLYFSRNVGAVVSYRHLEFDAEDTASPNFAKWKARGPFAGVNIRF